MDALRSEFEHRGAHHRLSHAAAAAGGGGESPAVSPRSAAGRSRRSLAAAAAAGGRGSRSRRRVCGGRRLRPLPSPSSASPPPPPPPPPPPVVFRERLCSKELRTIDRLINARTRVESRNRWVKAMHTKPPPKADTPSPCIGKGAVATPPPDNPFTLPQAHRRGPKPPARLPPISRILKGLEQERREAAEKQEEAAARAREAVREAGVTPLQRLQGTMPDPGGDGGDGADDDCPPSVALQLTAQTLVDKFFLTSKMGELAACLSLCGGGGGGGVSAAKKTGVGGVGVVPRRTRCSTFFSAACVVVFAKRLSTRLRGKQILAVFAALDNFNAHRNLVSLSKGYVRQLHLGFCALDKDVSGLVSLREFQVSAERVGRTFSSNLFRRLDRDRSGHVNFPELCRTLHPCVPRAKMDALIERTVQTRALVTESWEASFTPDLLNDIAKVYACYTADGTEKYTFAKYREQAPKEGLSEEELQAQFAEADTDKDGCLSFKEYAMTMQGPFKDDLLDASQNTLGDG